MLTNFQLSCCCCCSSSSSKIIVRTVISNEAVIEGRFAQLRRRFQSIGYWTAWRAGLGCLPHGAISLRRSAVEPQQGGGYSSRGRRHASELPVHGAAHRREYHPPDQWRATEERGELKGASGAVVGIHMCSVQLLEYYVTLFRTMLAVEIINVIN